MPEGDTVWRTARQLDAALSGRVLTSSDFRVPRFALTDLRGRLVTETISRGKHILTRVDGGLTVHTHLKMDGSWRIRPAAERTPRDHRIRLVLANDQWQALGYLLGEVDVLATAGEYRVVGHLGPDLLGPDWDADEAVRRLVGQPDRPVGEALLDQRNLAGIGNLYKAELLFLRGIDPWRPVGDVAGLAPLVKLAKRLLEANKERLSQVTTGVDRPGQQTWVYGRAGRPCRRCGTPIRSAEQGRDAGVSRRQQPAAPAQASSGPPSTGLASGGPPSTAPAQASGGPASGGPAERRRAATGRERITFWCPQCQPASAATGASGTDLDR